MFTGQYLKAFPGAKVYIPNRTAESWAKDKEKEQFIPRIAHTFGKGLGDPFQTLTNGEIQVADWGASHANEVRPAERPLRSPRHSARRNSADPESFDSLASPRRTSPSTTLPPKP